MNEFLPPDRSLPFFAYGAFRPGELAFLRIKPFASDCRAMRIEGQLRIRDGLPIAVDATDSTIDGCLISFARDKAAEAYKSIADLEPQKQYSWGTRNIDGGKANLLLGRSPSKGSSEIEEKWSGANDPPFTAALGVIEETLSQNREPAWDLKPLFRLEMAYLLLWTAIERYASLRYHLGTRATEKVREIANEPAFGAALARVVTEDRTVQRADNPTEKRTLKNTNPQAALDYYYQLRSNLVHRGKGVIRDHERIRDSLAELLEAFRATLKAAFEDSQWP